MGRVLGTTGNKPKPWLLSQKILFHISPLTPLLAKRFSPDRGCPFHMSTQGLATKSQGPGGCRVFSLSSLVWLHFYSLRMFSFMIRAFVDLFFWVADKHSRNRVSMLSNHKVPSQSPTQHYHHQHLGILFVLFYIINFWFPYVWISVSIMGWEPGNEFLASNSFLSIWYSHYVEIMLETFPERYRSN